jgi:hypothetical protein
MIMKRLFTLLFFTVLALGAKAQLENPITFEEGGMDTIWIPFANGADGTRDDLSVVLNPYATDVNSSDSVLEFVIHDDALNYVGFYSDQVGVMTFTEDEHTLTMMVLKDHFGPVRLKLERSLNSGEIYSVQVEPTMTDEWELLTFEFTDAIGYYYERLTVFPDFPATNDEVVGSTVYIDNIANPSEDHTSVKEFAGELLKVFPNPVDYRMAVVYPEMTGITVTDVLGKTVKTLAFPMRDNKVVEVGDLSTGVYYVTVESTNGYFTVPFMKK